MTATATLEDGKIWLRSYDRGEVFAVVLGPVAALILARDLLRVGLHDAGALEAALEQRVTDPEHNENI